MRKKLFLLLPACIIFQLVLSQGTGSGSKPGNYLLLPERHGVSWFAEVKLPHVRYEKEETISFSKYHSADVINSWLAEWAEKYPELIDLYEVGRSFEGRPIYQITLTNKSTGKDTDKPGAFFEGGRHSGEVTSCETVLWFTWYLLDNYGSDPLVTGLVDKNTFYLRPINNPDGHNLYMNTAQSNRSTVRPYDNDGDGLLDEDSPEDLDNDGMILTMRWKDPAKANMSSDPADTSGRIMKRAGEGEGVWLTAQEGIDNDNDGRINEDGIGGLDLHRNYPENWRPSSEETGRGYTQNGAGEYPLSEPETRSVVAFLLSHPNIYVVNSMDTSVPMHLRPPSTSGSEERMYPEDLKWYKYFDEAGKKITGYERAGDVFNDYGRGNPLFGHGPDFGYWYYGAIWYGDEIWNGARHKDYNGDGNIDQLDMILWDDSENDGMGFTEWHPARHPVYGDIEIGGFDPKFFSQNPPSKHLEPWIRNEALFNLEMAKHLPELAWEPVEVKKLKAYKTDSVDFQLKISFRNTGKLPTALRQAQLVKIVTEDRIVLEFDTTGTSGARTAWKLIEDKKQAPQRESRGGSQATGRPATVRTYSRNVPITEGGALTSSVFTIRLYNRSELSGKASVYSTRGGVLKDNSFVIR